MIILDTNVLSEFMRPRPEARVVAWLKEQFRSDVYTTAITRGEMLFGVHLLPDGQRKARMLQEVDAIFASDLAGRVLPYDSFAAEAYASIAAARRGKGQTTGLADAMISGIVASRDATLATRNLRDFTGCGIALVDPWH